MGTALCVDVLALSTSCCLVHISILGMLQPPIPNLAADDGQANVDIPMGSGLRQTATFSANVVP